MHIKQNTHLHHTTTRAIAIHTSSTPSAYPPEQESLRPAADGPERQGEESQGERDGREGKRGEKKKREKGGEKGREEKEMVRRSGGEEKNVVM
jgi:hypothetical protein